MNGNTRMLSLEMLRGLAALAVVLYHTDVIFGTRGDQPLLTRFFGAGYLGVDLFFVLSGLIIGLVHGKDIGRADRLPNYLFNRLTRIYPAVFVVSAFAGLVYFLGYGGADKQGKLAPLEVLASLLLLPQTGDALVNVTWSLKYEIFFYLLFGVLLINRLAGLMLLVGWQIATAFVALTGVDWGLPGFYFQAISLEFGVGLACAWLINRQRRPISSEAATWILAMGVSVISVAVVMDKGKEGAGGICVTGIVLLLFSLINLERSRSIRIPHLLVYLGSSSYAIYLVHFSVIALLGSILGRLGIQPSNLVCLTCALIGVLFGIAYHHAVDQPIQRWFHRRKNGILLRRMLEPAS